MAMHGDFLDRDQFCCSICLDLLKEPVTIPCGHSYCSSCIQGCWDQDEQKGLYSCPQCRESFSPRPALRKNNMLAEVVEKLKKTGGQQASSPSAAQDSVGPGDVACDFCTGSNQHKAIMSCLVCMASYCETHLQPHYAVPVLKKHKLVKATARLQEKMCSGHDKLLEVYCRTDQQCICYLCTMDEHKGHDTVSAAAERTDRQNQLGVTRHKVQQRVQEREKDLKELRQALESLRDSAQTAVEDSEKIFTELILSIEKKRSEVKELIRDQQKKAEGQAEGLLAQLEQEIAELRRRDAELEQLSHTDDNIHFLQSFQSLSSVSESSDVPSIVVRPLPYFRDVSEAVSDLREKLEDILKETWPKVSTTDPCPLTLDLKTLQAQLSLAEGNIKQDFGVLRQKVQQRVQERGQELKELRQSLCNLKMTHCDAVGNSEMITTKLILSIEIKPSEAQELLKDQLYTAMGQAEELLVQLEQEIAELRRGDAELELLSQTDKHVYFLRSFPSLSSLSVSSDVASVHLHPLRYPRDVRAAVSDLGEKLELILKETWPKITTTVSSVDFSTSHEPRTRDQFLQYSCFLSLDTNTTHNNIVVSSRKRTAKLTCKTDTYPNHPDRFTNWWQVLCMEGLSGRCYWEVEWSGYQVYTAVSYKGIRRTGGGNESHFGHNDKSWSLECYNSGYCFRHNNVVTEVSGPPSSRVGVYLDHKAGTLSFYSVSDTMTLLHKVQTRFTQPLYAGFWLHYDGDTVLLR